MEAEVPTPGPPPTSKKVPNMEELSSSTAERSGREKGAKVVGMEGSVVDNP